MFKRIKRFSARQHGQKGKRNCRHLRCEALETRMLLSSNQSSIDGHEGNRIAPEHQSGIEVEYRRQASTLEESSETSTGATSNAIDEGRRVASDHRDVAETHNSASQSSAKVKAAAARNLTRTEMTVPLREQLYVPPHALGDRDFKGNGPYVYVRAQLRIGPSGELQTQLQMYAFEWKNGRYNGSTAAFGTSPWETAFLPPFGSRVVEIMTPTSSFYSYVDRDHDLDSAYFSLPRDGLVSNFHLMGDTGKNDAGVRTGVTAFYRNARIAVEQTPQPTEGQFVLAQIPSQTYIPPHVRGDREFAGNGPRGRAFGELRVDSRGRLQTRVFMVAEEWKRGSLKWDYTTVRGWSAWRTVYVPPPGKRVLWVYSPTSATNRDAYHDTDHGYDYISGSNRLVRDFRFLGDTNGKEAGTRTSVQVNFNSVWLRVG